MIKSLIILALLLALLAAAALTRPTEADFKVWYKQTHAQKSGGNILVDIFKGNSVDSYLKACKFHNNILWTDVEKDGQTVYTGAFGHWVERKPTPSTKSSALSKSSNATRQ